MKAIITLVDKDIYNLTINGNYIGQFERSEIRHLIEQLDNNISI